MPDYCTLKSYLETATFVVTILGVPAAIYVYVLGKRKERADREYGTYDALDDKYIEFLKLCMEKPELNIRPGKQAKSVPLDEIKQGQRKLIYEILICLLERAFLMYKYHSTKVKEKQWKGWDAYMSDWMANEDFRQVWESDLSVQYDSEFVQHMNGKIKPVAKKRGFRFYLSNRYFVFLFRKRQIS